MLVWYRAGPKVTEVVARRWAQRSASSYFAEKIRAALFFELAIHASTSSCHGIQVPGEQDSSATFGFGMTK